MSTLGLQPSASLPGAPVTSAAGVTNGGLIRTYKAWRGNNVFFLDGRLIFGPDVLSIPFTVLLVTAPVIIFCVCVARKLMDDFPNNGGVSILVVVIVLTLLDLVFLFETSGRDPGIIPRNLCPPAPEGCEGGAEPRISRSPPPQLPRTKDVTVNKLTVKVKYCDTCMRYRLPRASHCSVCDNCVQKFDHHCPWLGQCIGLRNYRCFFMFVLCSTLICIYVHVFCWIYAKRIMDAEKITMWKALLKTPASITLILYTSVSGWFVGGLTCFHIYLISINQSTYENYRHRHEREENPFDKGILVNLLEVFCTSVPPSLNNFRAYVPRDTVITPSLERMVQNIEMGRRRGVWHETVDEELGILFQDTDSETVIEFSRILQPEEFQDMETKTLQKSGESETKNDGYDLDKGREENG